MPFRLNAIESSVARAINKLVEQRSATWEQVVGIVAHDESRSGRYSRPAVRAYVLGALGRWRTSEIFAEMAEAEADTVEREIEAKILRAHAWYRSDTGSKALRRALAYIESACDRARSELRVVDGRAEVLKGVIRYSIAWHRAREAKRPSIDRNALDECVAVWEEALEAAAEDGRLRAQCYNNLAYALVQRPETRDRARGMAGRVVEEMRKLHTPREDWPPVFRDTAVWVEWTTAEKSLPLAKLKEMVKELEAALGAVGLTGRQEADFRAHAATIRARIEERSRKEE
jgi:hypothetical protein